jgi:hypothetical protein
MHWSHIMTFKLWLKAKLIQISVKYPLYSIDEDKLKHGHVVLTGFTGYSRERKYP